MGTGHIEFIFHINVYWEYILFTFKIVIHPTSPEYATVEMFCQKMNLIINQMKRGNHLIPLIQKIISHDDNDSIETRWLILQWHKMVMELNRGEKYNEVVDNDVPACIDPALLMSKN